SHDDNGQEEAIACRPPKDGGCVPETRVPQNARHLGQVVLRWKDSIRANEPANLVGEGIERGKKYQSESTQKQPTRTQIPRRRGILTEQISRNRSKIEVHCGPLYRQSHATTLRDYQRNSGGKKYCDDRMEETFIGRRLDHQRPRLH